MGDGASIRNHAFVIAGLSQGIDRHITRPHVAGVGSQTAPEARGGLLADIVSVVHIRCGCIAAGVIALHIFYAGAAGSIVQQRSVQGASSTNKLPPFTLTSTFRGRANRPTQADRVTLAQMFAIGCAPSCDEMAGLQTLANGSAPRPLHALATAAAFVRSSFSLRRHQ